jgi:hypothetical protein
MTQSEMRDIVNRLIEELRDAREISGSSIADAAVKQGFPAEGRDQLVKLAGTILAQRFDPLYRTHRKIERFL